MNSPDAMTSASDRPIRAILFVCMGNICRSPTAEGVFRAKAQAAGLLPALRIDSAGTHGWHAGAPPDERSQHHAARRGYDLSSLRARAVRAADFHEFDLILAMDDDNLAHLREACPPAQRHKLLHLMAFAPPGLGRVVPDPYYGGADGFEAVLDLVERACEGLLAHLEGRNIGTDGTIS